MKNIEIESKKDVVIYVQSKDNTENLLEKQIEYIKDCLEKINAYTDSIYVDSEINDNRSSLNNLINNIKNQKNEKVYVSKFSVLDNDIKKLNKLYNEVFDKKLSSKC